MAAPATREARSEQRKGLKGPRSGGTFAELSGSGEFGSEPRSAEGSRKLIASRHTGELRHLREDPVQGPRAPQGTGGAELKLMASSETESRPPSRFEPWLLKF